MADEWTFLVDRELKPTSVLRSHNGHWSTVPIVLFRVNYALWGLNHYWPYQLLVVVAHLAVVGLAWVCARRLGVRGWIATTVVAPFIVFGTASVDILVAFQVGTVGAVALGLACLILFDRERDVFASVCAVLALASAAAGLPFVVGGAAVLLVQRGARAVLRIVPAVCVFVAWFLTVGNDVEQPRTLSNETGRFVIDLVGGAFEGLGGWPLIAVALGACALFGIAEVHGEPLAVGLVTSGLAFAGLTAIARGDSLPGDTPNYVYVLAALALPFIAVAAERINARRLALVVVLLIAIGLPTNIDLLRNRDQVSLGDAALVSAIAYSDCLGGLPPDSRFPVGYFGVGPTVRWLRTATRDGKIPRVEPQPDLSTTDDPFVRSRAGTYGGLMILKARSSASC